LENILGKEEVSLGGEAVVKVAFYQHPGEGLAVGRVKKVIPRLDVVLFVPQVHGKLAVNADVTEGSLIRQEVLIGI